VRLRLRVSIQKIEKKGFMKVNKAKLRAKTELWILKIKWRHVIALAIFMLSVAVTPIMMELAYLERDYKAYGSEFAIIPLGIVLAIIVLTTASIFDTARSENGANINMYPLWAKIKN